MKIPIENLYYLLCYAWNKLEATELFKSAAVQAERPEDLLGRLLREGTRHVLRRGLDRGYVEHGEDLASPRGKMDVAETGKRALLSRPAVHCRFDELSHDIPHNRVVKAALQALASSSSLDQDLRSDLARLCDRLKDVTTERLTGRLFRKVYIHRNNAAYGFLMSVCELIAKNLLPSPTGGAGLELRDFTGSDQQMGLMFEEFVRTFLAREQNWYGVDSRHVPWAGGGWDERDDLRLPTMRTDVTLSSPEERVVIETKFYSQPLASAMGGVAKVHSGHLYQLLSYVQNLAAKGRMSRPVRGLLLYATETRHLELRYRILGHDIYVRSLPLERPWNEVRADLLELVRPARPPAPLSLAGGPASAHA